MDVTIDCICPETPHESDTVTLRDRLDFRSASTILKAVQLMGAGDEDVDTAEILALLTENYLIYGIEAWTLVDAKRKPVPVGKAAIREVLFPSAAAMVVADAADELYSEQVMVPLVARAARLSRPSPTDELTSPKNDDSESQTPTSPEENSTSSSSPTPRKRSRPSSISTIPTASTAVTTSSLDGDSNTSQNSTSAA
jgi:hypothetical protein